MSISLVNRTSIPDFPTLKEAVKTKYHAFKKALSECFDTECKVYSLVIGGRLLQAAGIAACIAAVPLAIFVNVVYLVGFFPAVLSGMLGIWMIEKAIEMDPDNGLIADLSEAPFVPGQPVGLVNTGATCWLNSAFQCVMNTPELRERAMRNPQLQEAIAEYLQTQESATTHTALNLQKVNDYLIQEMEIARLGEALPGSNQADATKFFDWLLGQHPLYKFTKSIRFTPLRRAISGQSTSETERQDEAMFMLNSFSTNTSAPIAEQFESFFKYSDDEGSEINLYLDAVPDTLVVGIKRYRGVYDRTHQTFRQELIADPIQGVEEPLTLPNTAILGGNALQAKYACTSFTVHKGGFNGGHYIAYVKKDGQWSRCDDSIVRQVSEESAIAAMKKGNLFFYTRL